MIRPAPTAPADWSWVRMGFRVRTAGVSKSGSGFTGIWEFWKEVEELCYYFVFVKEEAGMPLC